MIDLASFVVSFENYRMLQDSELQVRTFVLEA